jgi:hypothetical protein
MVTEAIALAETTANSSGIDITTFLFDIIFGYFVIYNNIKKI